MIQFDERTSFSDGLVQLTRKRTEGKGLFGEHFQDVQTWRLVKKGDSWERLASFRFDYIVFFQKWRENDEATFTCAYV